MSATPRIADLSHQRQRLRLGGADRVAFLHGQCTNDVKRLRAGDSCYAAFLNAKGKMRGEGHIICRQNDFILEVNTELQPSLEKFIITEDVTIEDVSAQWHCYLLLGTTTAAPVPPNALTFPHPLGVGLLSPEPLTPTLSAEEFEALRIEAGIPKWGADMDENTIPIEAGLEQRAISYEKGCYIGQETIARIKTYGHVNRHLVQMVVNGDRLPVTGERIFSGGKEIGQITSAVMSAKLGKPLALGYVRRELARPGTKLKIGEQQAEVLRLCGQ